MPNSEEQTLFRYLDAKFADINRRLDTMEVAWQDASARNYTEHISLAARVGKLENWKAYATGALSIVGLVATGLVGWAWDLLRAVAAAK